MNETLKYYNENARAFADGTLNVDFKETQDRFLQKIPAGGRILDFGCGAGRDTKYFILNGYEVEALDGSEEMCRIASEYSGIAVRKALFEELAAKEEYDGIWACSSILHKKKAALIEILEKMAAAIKPDGYIYTSFKYGSFEGMRDGRYFTDFTEDSFSEFLENIPCLKVDEQWISSDARPGRSEEKWLNLILWRK